MIGLEKCIYKFACFDDISLHKSFKFLESFAEFRKPCRRIGDIGICMFISTGQGQDRQQKYDTNTSEIYKQRLEFETA